MRSSGQVVAYLLAILRLAAAAEPAIVAADEHIDGLTAATGCLELKTSDAALAAVFEWARRQALAYAFDGDPVGKWYEAALPGRQAFCMRDTAHPAAGAHMLGLADYTRNMLRKFARTFPIRRLVQLLGNQPRQPACPGGLSG